MSTYEESIQKLETLARQMESGELPVDSLADKLKEAEQLIADCRKQLLAADEQVRNILKKE